MWGESTDGRVKEKQDGRRGEKGQGPTYKALNSCSACSRSFPASLMGERIQGRDRKGQAGKSGLFKPEILYSMARGPLASINEVCMEGGRERMKGCWV